MKAGLKRLLVILVLVVCLVIPQGAFARAAEDAEDIDLGYIKGVFKMIREKYGDGVTDAQLFEGAIRGMLGAVDDYTTYFDMDEANSFLSGINGVYEGIGASISKIGDYVTVIKVFPASPAEKAGILSGDRIASVDGKSVFGASLEEVQSLLMGKAGTKVSIGVLRGNSGGIKTIEVVRDKIVVNPVSYEINGRIAYIKLDSFNANADEFLGKALEDIDRKRIRKVILDLRDNPGGLLDEAIAVARRFVPKGLITKLDYYSPREADQEYYSNLAKTKYQLVVLVNGRTASASEILAGAIQDTGAGILVGTKTFGKAKVQKTYQMLTPEAHKKYRDMLGEDVVNTYDLIVNHKIIPFVSEVGGYAKITVGEYITPGGRMIDGQGIMPDIVVDDYGLVNDIDIRSIQKLSKTSNLDINSEGLDVYNAEKILRALGYSVNYPDFKLDLRTKRAIEKFKEDNQLKSDGLLDIVTQDALNRKLEQLILEVDRQYAKAVEILKN